MTSDTEIRNTGNAGVPPAGAECGWDARVPNKGWHSRGYLPHLDADQTIQFISFRLHDAVPANIIEQWKEELHWTEKTASNSKEAATLRKKIEEYQDSGKGACYLRDERIAALVQDTLKRFDGERYRLIAWCVMPNHVHLLVEAKTGYPLSDTVHSWKSFSAHKANDLLGRKGKFWMPDYFDRFIRDGKHFVASCEYIRQNPVKAGLVVAPEDWPWGSAGSAAVPAADKGGRDARDPRDPRAPGE